MKSIDNYNQSNKMTSHLVAKCFAVLVVSCAVLFVGGCDKNSATDIPVKAEKTNNLPIKLTVVSETSTYPEHGFVNALDGDPNNNYVAGLENENQAVVELGMDVLASPTDLLLIWNDPTQFAKKVEVYGLTESEATLIGVVSITNGADIHIPLNSTSEFKSIRIAFSEFSGQSRVLLKLLELR